MGNRVVPRPHPSCRPGAGAQAPGARPRAPRVCRCRHVPRSPPTPNRPPTERGTWTKCGPSRGRLSSASCSAGGASILAKAWRAEPTTVTRQSRGSWAGGLTRKGRERTSGEGRVRVLIDHLLRLVSASFFYQKITIFPFVIGKYFLEIHCSITPIACSSNIHLPVSASLTSPA